MNTTTAGQLDRRIRSTIDELLVRPLPVPHALRPGVLTANDVQGIAFFFYDPFVG